ncbi:hypothetical protein NX722_09975 [Endozoicomonas gorgoniicola]|uniref:Uncharacterized protein n=1 Tax=Endozoicomonas gorgoniicola TaxID=1234144 RepID=A0ABT3MUC1_9GAMM|nr:hypothetical protein [Endozoicomonas gorgoniicola]MCW7552962.1 hypothetical protein [Endozoicomonas gorgoniicola]
MFLHPDPEQAEMLERLKKLIEAGRVKELSAEDVYRWGLRFLYGVDGLCTGQNI